MSTEQPFILFVPSYGKGGSGEFVRSVSLAQAAQARWPQARIEFLLPGGAGTRQDAPFPKHCHAGPEDDKDAFDREQILRLRPQLAVFDSGCRTSTLRLCHRLGIRTAYISDRHGTLRKAFRLEWLWRLDAHWHQREHLTAPPFTPRQRLLARLGRTRRLHFDTYFPEAAADWSQLPAVLRERLVRGYVLFSPGGGGYRVDGRLITDVFLDAAARVRRGAGLECLTLLGPLYPGAAPDDPELPTLREVPQALFLELMRRARVVVTNGGHSLHQALARGAVCVAAPLGGSDQPERIEAYGKAGLVRAAAPAAETLAAAACALAGDAAACSAIRRRIAALSIRNGIPVMLDGIAGLLGEAAAPAVPAACSGTDVSSV
ncbi:MAG: hypothetical protein ISP90_04035 [Nevskia sp.]|nr:hypothetical protein [Nevskia sp.]